MRTYLFLSLATRACSCFSSQLMSVGIAFGLIETPIKTLVINGSTLGTTCIFESIGELIVDWVDMFGSPTKEDFAVSCESDSHFG